MASWVHGTGPGALLASVSAVQVMQMNRSHRCQCYIGVFNVYFQNCALTCDILRRASDPAVQLKIELGMWTFIYF